MGNVLVQASNESALFQKTFLVGWNSLYKDFKLFAF